jgi:hypothetical protein
VVVHEDENADDGVEDVTPIFIDEKENGSGMKDSDSSDDGDGCPSPGIMRDIYSSDDEDSDSDDEKEAIVINTAPRRMSHYSKRKARFDIETIMQAENEEKEDEWIKINN